MESIIIVVVCSIILLAMIYFVIKDFIAKRGIRKAGEILRQVSPIWAVQAPFENGTESANAFMGAYIAVLGHEEAMEMEESIKQHAEAYDEDPSGWIEIINENKGKFTELMEDKLTIAEGYAAMQSLNEGMFGDIGYNLQYGEDENGNLAVTGKQTISDEEMEQKEQERAHTITLGFGQSIAQSETPAGKDLLQFIIELHDMGSPEEDLTELDVGRIYINLMNAENDEVEDDEVEDDEVEDDEVEDDEGGLLEEFKILHKAYLDEVEVDEDEEVT